MTTVLRPPNLLAPFDSTKISWHTAAMRDKSLVMLLTGSKGGGKSRLAAEKIHAYCLKYPGAMALVVRKTRESLMNSTVLVLQTQVIGGDSRVKWNGALHRFEYNNGSYLAVGGMKDEEQRQAVRSMGVNGALDIAWMEEANAFDENDFGEIIGCMRGRAAKWKQVILTTNPDGPDHWIRRRFLIGGKKIDGTLLPYHWERREAELVNKKTVVATTYYSAADGNPFNPEDYASVTLGMLTGVQYRRLVLGKWEQAEGAVYDNFDADYNVARVTYNAAQALYWCADDGYVYGGGPGTITYHPRVFLACQDNERGGMNVLAERYRCLESKYETSITEFQDMCEAKGIPREPDLCYVDSSAAMLRGAMGQHGLFHSGATHSVPEGVKNLRRLVADGQGMRLLQVDPDCENLIREFQMYQYEEVGSLPGGERKPAKKDDHGPDAARYGCWHLRTGDN